MAITVPAGNGLKAGKKAGDWTRSRKQKRTENKIRGDKRMKITLKDGSVKEYDSAKSSI